MIHPSKTFITATFMMLGFLRSFGQTPVTFNVNMLPVGSSDVLHVVGNFNDPNYDNIPENPDYQNWTPNASAGLMTDSDGDLVYTVVLWLQPGRYEFKFVNGDDWPFTENVPSTCTVEVNGNSNRQIMVGTEPISYSVCFGECADCGQNSIRLSVDMSNVDLDLDGIGGELGEDVHPEGVFVNGDFVGWSLFTPLQDWDGNKIWEGVIATYSASPIEYKFINGPDWVFPNEYLSGFCSNGNGNRVLNITDVNTVAPVVCWNTCAPCTLPVPITFQVDMNAACADLSPGVFLMGTLTDWSNGAAMSDDDGDGIWTKTLNLAPGNYEYKYRIGDSGWEGIGNRQLTVIAETPQEMSTVCFSSLEPCNMVVPPADVTFSINPGNTPMNGGEVIWVMGDFTQPNWQDGALMMSDADGDGIWSVTVPQVCPTTIFYKFRIGAPGSAFFNEETANFSNIGGCGVDNGSFSDIRVLNRTDGNPMAVCWLFNSCEQCNSLISGCTVSNACNYNPGANLDNGTCIFQGDDCSDGNPNTFGDVIQSNCQCAGTLLNPGCTNAFACNYDANANVDDGSCLVVGGGCNDLNPNTINDIIQDNCLCEGTYIDPGCAGFSINNAASNPTCAGLSNGFISINAAGTSSPFSYSWSNGATTSSINNISAGAYSVTITDATGCSETLNFNITAPTTLSATTTANAATCYGAASGSASALVTGGTAPYAYAWNTSPIQNTAQIDNVAAGIYTVNITDANGCVFSSSATISQPTQPLVVSATSTSASCSQSDGSASAVVTGNTAAIQYLWSNGQTGATASNLSAGAYTVTITSGGCSAQSTVNVNNINAPVINHVSSSPACFGANTGSINTIVTGGTQPYQYLWSNGEVGTAQSGLTAGTYTFIVIDNANCQSSIVVTLTQPDPINISLTATPTSCSGTPQGTVNATVSGGIQPYLYSWSNGSGGTAIDNLSAGQYTLTITDANNCNAGATEQVINPDGIIAFAITEDVNCLGGTDGSVEIIITEGTPPYSYEWNNGVTGAAVISNLNAGDYTCVITDANGCTFTATETVDQPQGNLPEILGQISVNPFSTETYSTAWQEGYDYSWTATGGNVLVGPNSNFIEVQWGGSGIGVVTLTLIGIDGCEIVNSLEVTIGASDISESTDHSMHVYPVPFSEVLTIATKDYLNNVPYEIVDATGKIVGSGTLNGTWNQLVTESFSQGLYLLKTNSHTFIISKF